MKGVRTFHVDEPFFERHLFVVHGGTRRELRALLKRRFGVEDDGEGEQDMNGESFQTTGYPWNVIWLSGKLDRAMLMKTLVHELYHFVTNVSDGIGLRPRVGDSEPGARLMGYYFEKVSSKLTTGRRKRAV